MFLLHVKNITLMKMFTISCSTYFLISDSQISHLGHMFIAYTFHFFVLIYSDINKAHIDLQMNSLTERSTTPLWLVPIDKQSLLTLCASPITLASTVSGYSCTAG